MPVTNAFGQLVGDPVPGWSPRPLPSREPLGGRYCRLTPLVVEDAAPLWRSYALDRDGRDWTYLPYGPFERFEEFESWVRASSLGSDPLFYAVTLSNGEEGAVGVASYLRIAPAVGTIEVGHIHFSPLLQRTPAATEAMYLMMRHAFELGYRRYEWKCDALNAPSRRAAERLGFSFEGIFRQAVVVKGRNRDTAWYACIDREWPARREAFERWLDPANFDAEGRQRQPLMVGVRS